MNTYYSYRSYRLGGRLLGTLGCGLAWAFFGSGWWSFLLGALLLFLSGETLFSHNHFLLHLLVQQHFTQGNSMGTD